MTDLELYFRFKCEKGLENKGFLNKKEYQNRLEYEMSIITQMGYCGYFLIVQDIIQWCTQKKIPCGPGRGSAAGAMTTYVLDITKLDPIKYNLIFERFLNPERISMPDIDMDFCEERRHEVIDYIINKYGKDKVAHIGTYGSMKAKAAIRDVARARGFDYQLGDKLARLILPPIEGKPQDLSICYEKVPELKNARNNGRNEEEVLKWAEQCENRLKSFSTHASGIVISDRPIYELIPLYPGKDKVPTTQFEMYTVEEVGLIKFDILGLRALTTIDRCVKNVAKRYGIAIDINKIPVNDKEIYKKLQEGDNVGIFQLEGSASIRDFLIKLRPTCLEDLATLVALYRPGPMASKEVAHFLDVRAGITTPNYAHPNLKKILGITDGLLIFQEQVLEICKQMAGYSMAQADLMRRAVGKKKKELMDIEYPKFIKGMKNNGYSEQLAQRLWDDIEAFAGYGFNLSHALCYAYIGYQMAYLKTHYTSEFMCSCLISDGNERDKVIGYISECRRLGIEILPPSINESDYSFSISNNNKSIRFGLTAIKNVGKPVDLIIKERKSGPFKDIIDFIKRIDTTKINKRQLESLVLSGAFDDINQYNRATLINTIGQIWKFKDEYKSYELKLETYNKKIEFWNKRQQEIKYWNSLSKDEQKKNKKPGRLKNPDKPLKPSFPIIIEIPSMSKEERLKNEKDLLGYYISGHPLDDIEYKSINSISDIKEINEEIKFTVEFNAIPSIIKEITTKRKKEKMAYITLEDQNDSIDAIIFPKSYLLYGNLINVNIPSTYKALVEVEQTDIGKIIKVIIKEIINLSQEKKYSNPIDLKIDLKYSEYIAKLLLSNYGNENDLDINLKIHSKEGNIWNFGFFKYKGSKTDLEKKIKEIVC